MKLEFSIARKPTYYTDCLLFHIFETTLCMGVLFSLMYVYHMCAHEGLLRSQRRASDPLEKISHDIKGKNWVHTL